MNKRLSRRLDKLEAKAELIQAESKAKKAKLLRLEQLEKENSIEAMFLRAELEYGRKLGLIDIYAIAQARKSKLDETERK
jgi:hypothetical protein